MASTPLILSRPSGSIIYVPDEIAGVPGLFEVPVAVRPPGVEFAYFLCQSQPAPPGHPPRLMVDYVGRTAALPARIAQHANDRRRDGLAPFARVFAAPVGTNDAGAVEAAMIRVCQPAYLAPRTPPGGYRHGTAWALRDVDRRALERWGYVFPPGH